MGHKSPYTVRGNNKIIPSLITKPEQGKKSREFSELIHRDLTEDTNTLSFYICPCRRNQADQAENNFMEYNEYYQDDKNKIDVLHGDKQSSKDPDGYIHRAEKGQRLIISIAHKVRLELVYKIIVKWINENHNHKVKIYLDESGESKTFNSFIKHIWSKLETEINRRLTNIFPIFIDAHLKALLNNKNFVKYFPRKAVHVLENKYDLDNYMFMSSMTYEPNEWNDTNDILESISEGNIEIVNNDYILWPFPKVKDLQYRDAEEISSSINNICVLDINGDGYHVCLNKNGKSKPKLTLPKRKCGKKKSCGHITCQKCNSECTDEMSAIKLIKKEYAFNIPLILCGHDCIDRAMTYHEPGFSFTKAFIARNNLLNDPFSNCSDVNFNELSSNKQEKVSQMVKRISGSFKDSLLKDKNPLPIIYGPQDIYYGICDLENKSTYIANQTGYITTELRNEMDSGRKMLCEYPLLNNGDIEQLEVEREPYDYYMIKFDHNDNNENLKNKLTEFRNKMGDSHVQLRTITKRLNGIEPDNNLGELKLEMFYTDYQLLKTALDHNTSSRIRVCKDENGEIKWIITFQMKREEFKWDDINLKIKKINGDGNCLFNCFIKARFISDLLEDFRYNIKEHMINCQSDYDKNSMSRRKWDLYTDPIKNNGEWNKDIFNIVPDVISKMLKLNIYIFNFKSMNNDGLNMTMDKPTIIGGNYDKNIYLRKLDNHYDLMEPL
jgi:hypothetical protein